MVEMPVAVASSVLSAVHQRRVHDGDAFALEKVEKLLGGVGRGEVRELGRERRERIDDEAARDWCARTCARSSPNWSSTLGPRVRVEYISSRPGLRDAARGGCPPTAGCARSGSRPRRSSRTACARRACRRRPRTVPTASTWRCRARRRSGRCCRGGSRRAACGRGAAAPTRSARR